MQPLLELRLHPVDLREFGVTPSGANIYRMVWADSRKSVAFRGDKRITTAKYQHSAESELAGKWILEKWLSAMEYYGMTAEKWETLQRVAPERVKYTPAKQSEIGKFLQGLPDDMRRKMESQMAGAAPEPIIEPYSHDGDYEFAGLYFNSIVEESYLRIQIRAHIFRLTHTSDADRAVESEKVEVKQELANVQKFDEVFDESRELALSAV